MKNKTFKNFAHVFLYFSFLIKFNMAETFYFHANYMKTFFDVISMEIKFFVVYSNV